MSWPRRRAASVTRQVQVSRRRIDNPFRVRQRGNDDVFGLFGRAGYFFVVKFRDDCGERVEEADGAPLPGLDAEPGRGAYPALTADDEGSRRQSGLDDSVRGNRCRQTALMAGH